MNVFRLFDIGGKKILAVDCSVPGTVTAVNRCWWLKVNTKPVRRFSGDGAVYPSIITFSIRWTTFPMWESSTFPIITASPKQEKRLTFTTTRQTQRNMPATLLARHLHNGENYVEISLPRSRPRRYRGTE